MSNACWRLALALGGRVIPRLGILRPQAEKKHTQDMARLRWQQKVLKQNLDEMTSSSVVVSSETSSPVEGKENSINDGQSS